MFPPPPPKELVSCIGNWFHLVLRGWESAKQLKQMMLCSPDRYPALINRKRVLIQHDNGPAHTSNVGRGQLAEQKGITVLSHLPYDPDLAPYDYYLFCAMPHFLQGQKFSSLEEAEAVVWDLLASKPSKWYYKGLLALAEWWQKLWTVFLIVKLHHYQHYVPPGAHLSMYYVACLNVAVKCCKNVTNFDSPW